jgi:membrane-bound inhibitor of C-type lysozyme
MELWLLDGVFRAMRIVGARGSIAAVLMAMLSCSTTRKETEQKWLTFRCPDGQTVMAQFQLTEDQFVNVRFAGREMRLPHVISGSGARYSDGKTAFWNEARAYFCK